MVRAVQRVAARCSAYASSRFDSASASRSATWRCVVSLRPNRYNATKQTNTRPRARTPQHRRVRTAEYVLPRLLTTTAESNRSRTFDAISTDVISVT